jgi:hypothetical protein
MPKRIPIAAAKRIAKEYALRQVIIMAWDGKLTHCVTYGVSVEECDQAAQGGNRIKQALGWPESLRAEPSRVRAMRRRIESLLAEVAELRRKGENHETR